MWRREEPRMTLGFQLEWLGDAAAISLEEEITAGEPGVTRERSFLSSGLRVCAGWGVGTHVRTIHTDDQRLWMEELTWGQSVVNEGPGPSPGT